MEHLSNTFLTPRPRVNITGWDKVDKLARALINTKGLCISMVEADNIKRLYHNLIEFDKKPVVYKPIPHRQPKGRFARSKRSGHATVDLMKR